MRYSVNQPPIQTLLTWIEEGDVAIPEIQRPFVWSAVKVRNLLDSLFRGYPIGYLIAWRNPDARLRDGTSSSGKQILIDGQQRVIALMAALLGREVVTKDYQQVRIPSLFTPASSSSRYGTHSSPGMPRGYQISRWFSIPAPACSIL